MNLTERHISNEIVSRAVRGALDGVGSTLERQAAMAQTGSSGLVQLNGEYSQTGEFVPYLRLDLDRLDSGRGCAP